MCLLGILLIKIADKLVLIAFLSDFYIAAYHQSFAWSICTHGFRSISAIDKAKLDHVFTIFTHLSLHNVIRVIKKKKRADFSEFYFVNIKHTLNSREDYANKSKFLFLFYE